MPTTDYEGVYRARSPEVRPEADVREKPTNDRNRSMRLRQHPETLRWTYVCLVLQQPYLSRMLRQMLEAIGVECLDEGGPHKAYGIVPDVEVAMKFLEKIEGVLSVFPEEPACSK